MIREATESVTGREIAEQLRPVLLRLARGLRRETEQLGVTSRQAALLGTLSQSPGLSPGELARAEGISAPSLSGHLDRLEAAGLVARVRADDDRRRVGVALTPEGTRLIRRIRARRTTWLAERLDGLERDQLAAVADALPALRLLVEDAS